MFNFIKRWRIRKKLLSKHKDKIDKFLEKEDARLLRMPTEAVEARKNNVNADPLAFEKKKLRELEERIGLRRQITTLEKKFGVPQGETEEAEEEEEEEEAAVKLVYKFLPLLEQRGYTEQANKIRTWITAVKEQDFSKIRKLEAPLQVPQPRREESEVI